MVASQPARQRSARRNQRSFCRSARPFDKRPRAGSATCSTPSACASRSFFAYGDFKRKDKRCPNCKKQYSTFEEKQTDLNIALQLFQLAVKDDMIEP